MRRLLLAGAIAAVAALSQAPAQAQDSIPTLPTPDFGLSPQEELHNQFALVRDVSGALRDKVTVATQRLQQVGNLEPSRLEAEISAMFDDLKNEVELIIEETSATSDLRNALSRAREQTIVFRDDLQRKPADHPNRGANLARLETAIAVYEKLREDLNARRSQALDALYRLGQQQNMIVEQIRLQQIFQAQEALSEVVSGLAVLAESIGDLQPPAIDGGIIN